MFFRSTLSNVKNSIYTFKGRKFSIKFLREKFAQNHKDYLRIQPDTFYEDLSIKKLRQEYQRINEVR